MSSLQKPKQKPDSQSWQESSNLLYSENLYLRVSSTEPLLCFQPRPIILGFNLDKNKYGMRKLQRTPWPRRLRVYVRKNQLWRAHYSGIIHLQRQKDLFRINLVSYWGLSRLFRINLGQNGLCYPKVYKKSWCFLYPTPWLTRNSFYTNFTNTTFQKEPRYMYLTRIPSLTHTYLLFHITRNSRKVKI